MSTPNVEERVGLSVIETKGLTLLSPVCGFLQVREMLGDGGSMRRTHVVVAGKSAKGATAAFKRRVTRCN